MLDYMRWLIEETDTDPLSDQERADIERARPSVPEAAAKVGKGEARPWLMRCPLPSGAALPGTLRPAEQSALLHVWRNWTKRLTSKANPCKA